MSYFAAIFSIEWKRFFKIKNLILLSIIFLFSHILLNMGVKDFRSSLEKSEKFRVIEVKNFEKHNFYNFYGDEGINTFFVPGTTSVFFRNTPITNDLLSNIDSKVTVRIFNLYKGKSLYKKNLSGPWGLSDFLLLIVGLLAIFYGFDSLRHKSFLKSLSSLCPGKRLFFYVTLSRFAVIVIGFVFLFATFLISLYLKNITLSSTDYINLSGYVFSAILTMLFFFACGVLIGLKTKSMGSGLVSIITVWIIFLFILPGLIITITENNAVDSIKDFQTELDKMQIILDFEKRSLEKAGKFDKNRLEPFIELVEEYWKFDYPQIEGLENKLKKEIIKNNDIYRKLSLFVPTSFYYLSADEVSSKGYESFIKFYSYNQGLKKKFLRFWIDRVYYNDPKILVNFVKDDENLFRATSRLPKNFLTGILITLAYIIVLFIISYFLFMKSFYKIKKFDMKKLGEVDIELNNGDLQLWAVRGCVFESLLFNLFSGNYEKVNKKGFTGKVKINGVDIAAEKNKEDFLYLCRAESLPGDLRVKDFINLYARMLKIPPENKKDILNKKEIKDIAGKTFSDLSNEKRFAVLLSLLEMEKKQVYLIYNTATGLPLECGVELNNKMNELKAQGSLVIYLTSTIRADGRESKMNGYYGSGLGWEYLVRGFEEENA